MKLAKYLIVFLLGAIVCGIFMSYLSAEQGKIFFSLMNMAEKYLLLSIGTIIGVVLMACLAVGKQDDLHSGRIDG